MSATYEQTHAALTLALKMLLKHEPPDSRAVSDEFVAMAAIQSGHCNARIMAIIEKGLADGTPAPEASGPQDPQV